MKYHHHYAPNKNKGMCTRASWVAEILGTDPRYKFARWFLRGKTDMGGGWRATEWLLEDGLYEIQDHITWSRCDRYFARVQDGDLFRIDEETLRTLLAERDMACA